MSQMKKILSLIIAVIIAFSLAVTGIADDNVPTVIYTNGTDGTNWGDSYAYIDTLSIAGADVYSYVWNGNNCTLKLNPDTAKDAELELAFTVGGRFSTRFSSATLNGTDIKSAKKGALVLEGGAATATIYAKGLMSAVTKTINIEIVPTTPPVCLKTEDSVEGYTGVEHVIDIAGYFEGADTYYLVNEDGTKEELPDKTYSFTPSVAGNYTYTFAASNEFGGDCPDTVTVTAEIGEITSGAWLGIETSNGSVNYVKFTDSEGTEIENLTVSFEGTVITVTLPRTYALNGRITATFDLTQNGGYPKLSTSNKFNGTNDNKVYNTTLSSGIGSATMYLYNTAPKATSNNYTTYTINYAIENEIPTLSDGQEETSSAEIVAGEAYTLDLSDVFSDADGDTLTYTVKVNGEAAVSADMNYSFTPTVGGTYTLEFFASDSIATSEDSYTVTLTVTNSDVTYDMTVMLPSDITPSFYVTSGYDENGTDILGDVLRAVAGETSDDKTPYTVSVPENISVISVRDAAYGSMIIPASSGSSISLCKVQTEITDLGDSVIAGTVGVSYDNHKAVGVDGKYLLLTEKEYTFTATPSETSKYNTASEAVTLSEDINKVTIKVSYKNPKTIITTTGAVAKLFKYSNNYYVHTVYEPLATVDNGDGTSTHYFAANGDLSYRVSMDGKITKAGYLTRNSVTVLYSEEDALPKDRIDYAAAGTDASSVADDSLLLNINQQNHLSLSVGESKTIKGYRAWEIINNHMNHIIAPDFNFNIISGEDVVSLSPYENQPMTNSSGNWRTLTVIGEGTAIVEVTYDAMVIAGGSYSGFYGATDDARTGLFVVTVGSETPDVDFGIECRTSAGSTVYQEANKKPWDSEFDTVYFFGESGEIKLSPSLADGNITEVAVSSDKGENYTVIEGTDGIYTVPIAPGNNIIRVTTDLGVAYQIVRGDKVELVVKNLTNPDKPIAAGDEVSLKLVGVHTPVPKISGTFNPGYSGNTDGDSKAHIRYSFGEETITSTGKQYDFSLNGTTMEFTVPSESEETEFKLTDGYIGVGVIGVQGFSDDGDSHRNIPDSGSGTRGSQTTFTTRSILPDITVSIGMLPSDNTAPFIRETAPQSATLNLGGTYALSMSRVFTDRDGDTMTYTAKVGEGETATIEEYYTFTPDATGTYTIVFTANDGKTESDAHTITLTVKEKENTSSSKPSLDFDITGDDIEGYVKISFTDKGKRVEGEANVKYPKALGTIISSVQVPFAEGDTVADVTLRLLDAKEFTYQYTGTTKDGFYLSAIGDFTHKGIDYDSFGEFDAGSGSGWMITLNKTFIEYGASDFEVKNGDTIKWQYTCQLGADIGDPFYSGTTSSTVKKDEEKKEDETTAKPVFTETTFSDIKKDDWHYESVKYVYENSLMQGTENGFEPENKMSRAMLVTVLYRMAKPESKTSNHSFEDVESGQWYTDAVAWAAENNIVSAVSENKFAPNEDITREQMALIIYRFAKMQGYDISGTADISAFEDTNDVSDWALDAIKWANGVTLVNGTSDTTLSPKDTATRAQVATILMRFCENIAK